MSDGREAARAAVAGLLESFAAGLDWLPKGEEFRFYRDSNGNWWGKVHTLGGPRLCRASGDSFSEMVNALRDARASQP